MGFSGGSEQGKLVTALLQLKMYISAKLIRVNPNPSWKTYYMEVTDNNT